MNIPGGINARFRARERSDEWLRVLWQLLAMFGARESARAAEIERALRRVLRTPMTAEERELCRHERLDVAEQLERERGEAR